MKEKQEESGIKYTLKWINYASLIILSGAIGAYFEGMFIKDVILLFIVVECIMIIVILIFAYANKKLLIKFEKKTYFILFVLLFLICIGTLIFLIILFLRPLDLVKPVNSKVLNLTLVNPERLTLTFKPVSSSLEPNHYDYLPFVNQKLLGKLFKTEIKSNISIEVYVVTDKSDVEKFINGENFSFYKGCIMEGNEGTFICRDVSTGGILVYNPNSIRTNYTILFVDF